MASSAETDTAEVMERLRPGPRKLPRVQVAEIQRGRLLSATVDVIDEVGYSRMTVAQVIARAKVSRKTFYDLFVDREDCFLAVFDQTVERAGGLAGEAYAKQRNWRDGVRAGLLALLRFMDEHPALARICVVEALGAGPRVLESRARAIDALKRVIAEGEPAGRRRAGTRRKQSADIAVEGVVGAALTVIHSRVLEPDHAPLVNLLGPLMSLIVLPYRGARAASEELSRPSPKGRRRKAPSRTDPLGGLDMRLTYRTMRVLSFIDEHPRASNREVAEGAGIADQGQMSKLLARLERLGLLSNSGAGQRHGSCNEWRLTDRGKSVERAARPPLR
jgi:AcrR family transcriptional regulator/DNA-binding MarR family transcriptional regulator